MATSDEARLLSLPMELLTRITDELEEESLSTLRLTCKTLEIATFDRFAATFTYRHCCIYYETRWTSLKSFLRGSSIRLLRAMHHLTFTTMPLEGYDFDEVQLAPGHQFTRIRDAQIQFDAEEADHQHPYESLGNDNQPVAALVHSVFLDIARYAPHLSVELDFRDNLHFRLQGIMTHKDVLLAAVSTCCLISDLTLTRQITVDFEEIATHLGERMTYCTSNIRSISFTTTNDRTLPDEAEFDIAELASILRVLRNAKTLTELFLRPADYMRFNDPWAVTEKLLYANDLSTIDKLHLQTIAMTANQMCKVLTRCQTNLQDLCISSVLMAGPAENWKDVFRLLTTFEELQKVVFSDLSCLTLDGELVEQVNFKHVPQTAKFSNLVDEPVSNHSGYGILLRGKEEIATGLSAILSGPIRFSRP